MDKQTSTRSLYWDSVKGLGIIAIVLGHSGWFGGPFVYLFHLALFFFITGYFYQEDKYGDAPFLYLGARISGVWPKYMFYTLFFVLFHNFFVLHNLYVPGGPEALYNHTQMLAAWMSCLSFDCPEQTSSALWFVPVWLASSALFGGCVWFGRTLSRRLARPEWKPYLIGLSTILPGFIGYFLNMRKCRLPYNLQTALLVVPLYFAAWLIKPVFPKMKRLTPWYGCILSAILLHLCNSRLHIYIDLSYMDVPGLWFYFTSALGIYFVLSFAYITERFLPLQKLLAFLGRQSFDIMAIHFFVFKLMDYGYARIVLKEIPEYLSAFPVSFRQELGPFYFLFGLLLPAVIGWAVDEAVRRAARFPG